MSDEPSHSADDFQLDGLKNTITGKESNARSDEAGDDLQAQFSQEGNEKETQYVLLQLVSMVREKPLLYDEELQASVPEAQLKRQKREAWDRIRADMMWQDMTPVQEVWSELLEQYSRKSEDLSDTMLEAMRWTDAHVSKKKSNIDSRPPSQMNSSLDKDFFGDVPLAEDVLVTGQSIGSPTSSLNMIRDYVVIQPSRRAGSEIEADSRPSSSIQTSSTQYSRRKISQGRDTEAVVRTYPLPTKSSSLNARTQVHLEQKVIKGLHDVKKELKEDVAQTNYGRPGVLVEVEHGFESGNQKIYKLMHGHRSTPPQATARVTPGRRLITMHRGSSFTYETVPAEAIIESPENPIEPPPKKKIQMDDLRHHRTVSMVTPQSSKGRIGNTTVSILSERAADKLISERVVEEEIIMEENECKPLVGTELLLSRQGPRSSTQRVSSSSHDQNMQSTSADDIHHYHHEEIEDGGVVEDIEQQVVVEQADVIAIQSMQAIQYDEDLAFQQHINSVLNRLNDDEKALMKFNMQKIILDARFGAGTARNMIKEDEMLEAAAQGHDVDEPVVEEVNPSQL